MVDLENIFGNMRDGPPDDYLHKFLMELIEDDAEKGLLSSDSYQKLSQFAKKIHATRDEILRSLWYDNRQFIFCIKDLKKNLVQLNNDLVQTTKDRDKMSEKRYYEQEMNMLYHLKCCFLEDKIKMLKDYAPPLDKNGNANERGIKMVERHIKVLEEKNEHLDDDLPIALRKRPRYTDERGRAEFERFISQAFA